MNLQDFYRGRSFDAYTFFGAHRIPEGVIFRTYAPRAAKVYLTGTFTGWQMQEMLQQDNSGVFELSVETARVGDTYKFVVQDTDDRLVHHADPYGFGMELRPDNASIVTDLSAYTFHDDVWLAQRDKNLTRPLNIYEVHLGSWLRNEDAPNGWFGYRQIADRLIAYAKDNHYTHLEFLPLTEHPSDQSWGYQVSGFFSPTSRYGTAQELMALIDECHQAGIGVIMDFVPVHFALDDYGLSQFDGTALYEYPRSDVGRSEWGTRNFNHARGEVRSFLQSAANYWLTEYHVDGLRMDAISRILYWHGDTARGINVKGVEFVKRMNAGLQALHPDSMLIAEDSTSFPLVTTPVAEGGLGFDYKWDLGWMNDTLQFFGMPPGERVSKSFMLSFSMHYFFNERYILSLSHDEVVHEKGTILNKMWGDYEERFKQARTLFLYMYTHPGKKLNFMGNEIAHFREWDEKRQQDWELLQYPAHDSFHRFMVDLGRIYHDSSALWASDFDHQAFHWLNTSTHGQGIFAYERRHGTKRLITVLNLSARNHEYFRLALPDKVRLRELLNTNLDIYGGTAGSLLNREASPGDKLGQDHVYAMRLPAFSGRLFAVEDLGHEAR